MNADYKLPGWLHFVFLYLFSVASFADIPTPQETLAVQVPADYETPEAIPEKVRAECSELGESLAQGVGNKLSQQGFAKISYVRSRVAASEEKLLVLRILNVNATPGGGWTGAKSLSVRANLYQNGNLIVWRVFTRRSKSAVGGYGNCNILGHDADVIAADVYRWLVKSQKSTTLSAVLVGIGARANSSIDEHTHADELPTQQQDRPAPPVTETSSSSEVLLLDEKSTYVNPEEIPLKIFNECHLDITMGSHMLTVFSQHMNNVMPLKNADSTNSMILKYEIVGATGSPGGLGTGRKTLMIRAILYRDEEVIDTFNDSYVSKKPIFPAAIDPTALYRYGGTCDALSAGAKVLASRTFKWYSNRNRPSTHTN